uniref:RRM domain-containing protein n=1 Tax=Xiphophorus couchianus TaxID=32473 RepID=A0A3B5LFA3_9TELE
PTPFTLLYHLVKLLEKFGKVKQFDFLFHKSGPLEGQPRGYCFVNFSTREVNKPDMYHFFGFYLICCKYSAHIIWVCVGKLY